MQRENISHSGPSINSCVCIPIYNFQKISLTLDKQEAKCGSTHLQSPHTRDRSRQSRNQKKKNLKKKIQQATTKPEESSVEKTEVCKNRMKGKGRKRNHNGHKAEEQEWGEQLLLTKNRSLTWVWRDLTPIPTPIMVPGYQCGSILSTMEK